MMTHDKGISINNIYHMLTYAFQVLRQSNYKKIASEKFRNVHDLLAAILAIGIAQQIKQGLHREYINGSDNLSTMRGKLNIYRTINNRLQRNRKLFCEYDELSENNIYNQILKTAVAILLRQPSVHDSRVAELKKVMLFLGGVDILDPGHIKWHSLSYRKNSLGYEMLLNKNK